MDLLHRQIAALYRGVFTQTLEAFRDFALECLRPVVAFDSAVWANGDSGINAVHSLHVHNQAVGDVMVLATLYSDEDYIRARSVADPGKAYRIEDTMDFADYPNLRFYRDMGARMGIENSVGLSLFDPVSNLASFAALWRSDRAASYSDEDCRLFEQFFPHMLEAWHHAQVGALLDLRSPVGDAEEPFRWGRAVIDRVGGLTSLDREFADALRSEWPDWQGPLLPRELAEWACGDEPFLELGATRFEITRGEQYHVLGVARTGRETVLSAAEMDVARQFAAGESYKNIARHRACSPATVRNQIARIYQKLDVHSRADLARRIGPARLAP